MNNIYRIIFIINIVMVLINILTCTGNREKYYLQVGTKHELIILGTIKLLLSFLPGTKQTMI